MPRAIAVLPAGHWSQSAADSVVLDFDERYRRRVAMTGVQGLAFLLDLPEAVMLRGGDALTLDDGRVVEVVAAPEALVEVRGALPADLVRLAWHIGNRHLPAQVTPRAIRLRRDHVIEDMLRGLGARLTPIEAPFDPEGGAYAAAPHAEHAHQGHDHAGHAHAGHAHAGHDHGGHGHGAHDHEHGSHGHAHHDHGHAHRHD